MGNGKRGRARDVNGQAGPRVPGIPANRKPCPDIAYPAYNGQAGSRQRPSRRRTFGAPTGFWYSCVDLAGAGAAARTTEVPDSPRVARTRRTHAAGRGISWEGSRVRPCSQGQYEKSIHLLQDSYSLI